MEKDLSFIKQKELIFKNDLHEPYAFATYEIDSTIHTTRIIEEIAIGQSIGSWETSHITAKELEPLVAKVVSVQEFDNISKDDAQEFNREAAGRESVGRQLFMAKIAFPISLWHGNLSWLLTLLYGKMSFYKGVRLIDVSFSPSCFSHVNTGSSLSGPLHRIEDFRRHFSSTSHTQEASPQNPLLMGILKPNVAMSPQKIADLYVASAQAGIHFLKDDEIRFDVHPKEILARVRAVANEASKRNLKTIYAVHIPYNTAHYAAFIQELENEGAMAYLINTWTMGLHTLQSLRCATKKPILSHPALVGAFGTSNESAIHPRVSMGSFLRAAGADLSLFPSPYGKIGLTKEIALNIAHTCRDENTRNWRILPTIPVPSAGIQPEHGPMAIADFGKDFILNAGTAIFSGTHSIEQNVSAFLKNLVLRN
jgi:2,3-diketo-5-methylthiopentyl-1-phosphate enolase